MRPEDGNQDFHLEVNFGDLPNLVAQVAVVVFVGGAFSLCCCRLCCGRLCPCRRSSGAPAPAQKVLVGGREEMVDHLARPKTALVAYILWLLGGVLGAHHFYLDRIVHGLLAGWTANFFGLGYLLDAALIPCYVWRSNKGISASAPPQPVGALRLWARLTSAMLLYVVLVTLVYTKLPRSLHSAGVLDLDARMAQTSANPYDLLGVARGADARAVEKAYKESLRRLGDCKPKSPCEAAKSDLKKARQFAVRTIALKERAILQQPRPERPKRGEEDPAGRSADDDLLVLEWQALFTAWKEEARSWAKQFEAAEGRRGTGGSEEEL